MNNKKEELMENLEKSLAHDLTLLQQDDIEKQKKIIDKRQIVDIWKKRLLYFCKTIENGPNNEISNNEILNNENISALNLKGFSDKVEQDMDQYIDLFNDIYDKYGNKN